MIIHSFKSSNIYNSCFFFVANFNSWIIFGSVSRFVATFSSFVYITQNILNYYHIPDNMNTTLLRLYFGILL